MTPEQFLEESTHIYSETVAMMERGADAYIESLLEPLRLELERTRQRIDALDKPEIPMVRTGQGTSQVDTYEKDIPQAGGFRRWLRDKVAFFRG